MQTAITVRGHFVGPTTIELDEPMAPMTGPVEVCVRSVDSARLVPNGPSLLEFIDRLPPGKRSAEDIDAQVEAEKASWE